MCSENNSGSWFRLHGPLLYKTILRLGFNSIEAEGLVNEVCTSACLPEAQMENKYKLKLRLWKPLVHKCVSRLSAELFSKNSSDPHAPGPATVSVSFCKEPRKLNFRDMPLCFRIVYILRTEAGFSEEEVAEMLNSTTLQVRKRLNKARLFIDTYLLT
jgi:DNA-directed RNA polymerase specialized sigma24 family protein